MKIGLALSGGAARGIAHIGVLKYLEERNVKAVLIAGTSAGSIVASLYSAGKTIEEIEQIARELSWKDFVTLSLPRKGLISSSKLLEMLKEHLGNIIFEDLKIPLIINAVDLLSGEEIIIEDGPVAEAVQASCSIPGIFTPVKWKDKLLVDGGLLDNVPAVLLKERNLDYIIAVDVGAQKPLSSEPDSIFKILIQAFDIIQRQRDKSVHDMADVVIEPELGDITMWDINRVDLIMERGYEAARKILGNTDLTKKQSGIARWFSKRENRR
ncbi:MAG: patatin-like phospholipase family protein [Bacillota bacterium]|nr:patatin-like phospholipase family protein [Bacillota bacterium]